QTRSLLLPLLLQSQSLTVSFCGAAHVRLLISLSDHPFDLLAVAVQTIRNRAYRNTASVQLSDVSLNSSWELAFTDICRFIDVLHAYAPCITVNDCRNISSCSRVSLSIL